ncbi:MAG: DUF3089 domain-containing protein [Alphaproteobacteria bacterium]|nr:DUF3089 domain-containing protein [Alphaproteobacteria bacterium]
MYRFFLKWARTRRLLLLSAAGVCFAGSLAAIFASRPEPIDPPVLSGPWTGDYRKAYAWALRPPGPPPGGWETPWGVDVFFIHPATTTSDGESLIPGDEASDQRLFNTILPSHAGPFASAGPIYAPRYRQFRRGDPELAQDLAYIDILHAFDAYMGSDNRARGVMLVGIGEGADLAFRLLEDRFRSEPLASRLAAAYLIDAEVSQTEADRLLRQPICERENETGCLIAWSWSPAAETGLNDLVCINPVSWRRDDGATPKSAHRGGARVQGAQRPVIHPAEVSASCRDGRLTVTRPTSPDLKTDAGPQNLTPTFNLFYADLSRNAALRASAASAWMQTNLRKPAPPLPAPEALEEAPIHRADGHVHPVTP